MAQQGAGEAMQAAASSPDATIKAQALKEAHQLRVEAEARAYLEGEGVKIDAKALKQQAKAESKKMYEESKAVQFHKHQEKRADDIVHHTQVKAGKAVAKSGQEAHRIKSDAQVEEARRIAEASMWAEQEKAHIAEETKAHKAELQDKVEQMVAVGELPPHKPKGLVEKIKHKLAH